MDKFNLSEKATIPLIITINDVALVKWNSELRAFFVHFGKKTKRKDSITRQEQSAIVSIKKFPKKLQNFDAAIEYAKKLGFRGIIWQSESKGNYVFERYGQFIDFLTTKRKDIRYW